MVNFSDKLNLQNIKFPHPSGQTSLILCLLRVITKKFSRQIKEEFIYCNTRLSIFLGWHKVMESIDCALELGYDPVKVNFSLSTDFLFNHISSVKIQKRGWVGGRTLVCKTDMVEPPCATTCRKWPPPISDRLFKTPILSQSKPYSWNFC